MTPDLLDEALDMIIHSGDEIDLETLTLAVMTLKRKYRAEQLKKEADDKTVA